MIFKLHEDFLNVTDGVGQYEVKGATVKVCFDRLLTRFPQLAVFLYENNYEEAKKTSITLDDETEIVDHKDIVAKVTADSVIYLGRDIPCGEKAVGMILAGVVLLVAGFFTGGSTWAYAGTLQSMLYSMGAGLIMNGVGQLIAGKPSLPSNDGTTDSATYSFNGISNSTQEGTPIGVVYGEHRVGGHVLNVFTDVDGTDNFLYAQLGLCEGEIGGVSNVEVGGRSASSFSTDVEYVVRTGTKDQPIMKWFNRVENTVSKNFPAVSPSGLVVQTDDIVDAVKLTIKAPSLFRIRTKGIVATTVRYRIDYRTQGSADAWAPASVPTASLSGNTKAAIYAEHLLEFDEAGVYEMKITLTSSDNSNNTDVTDSIYIDSINKLVYGEYAYPNTAILGVKIKATNQLSGGMPIITSLVKGTKIRVPSNYDPETRTHSGVWDGQLSAPVYSNNPAWCIYDLVSSTRYGIGKHSRFSEKATGRLLAQLYILGKYCDEPMDDGLPRFQLDIVLDSAMAAFEWLGIMSSMMRAAFFTTDGSVSIAADREKEISHIFSMGNIIKGSYTQSCSSSRNIPNVIEVQFYDRDDGYKPKMFKLECKEVITDPLIEPKSKSLKVLGVTRLSQAMRAARFTLLASRYNTKVVTFKASTDSLNCTVGDVVGMQHDVPQWGVGGRLISVDYEAVSVTLDTETTLESGKSYVIKIQQGSRVHTADVLNNPETTSTLFLNALPQDYEVRKDAVTSVGEIDIEVKPLRVLSIRREADETAEISATDYTESIYAAADDLSGFTEVLVHDYSTLTDPTDISVNGVTATERIYLGGDGTIRTGIDVYYTLPISSSFWGGATVYYGHEGSGVYDQTSVDVSGNVFIPGLTEQQAWEIVVCSNYKAGGVQSVSEAKANGAAVVLYLYGKTKAPLDITVFSATQNKWNNNFAQLTWEPGKDIYNYPDPDISHYEIRVGADWANGSIIATAVKELFYNEYFLPSSGTYNMMVKTVDTSGNYSANAAVSSIVATVEPANVRGFRSAQAGDEIMLTWDSNADTDLSGYEVRVGVSWETAAVVNALVQGVYLRVSGITTGTARYMIKAKDRFGNESIAAAGSLITVTNLPDFNVVTSYDEVATGWIGTHDKTVNNGGELTLATNYLWDSGVELWDDPLLNWDDAVLGNGVYESAVFDIGAIVNTQVILEYESDLSIGNTVKIEMAHSTDNVTYTEYLSFYGGYVTARYIKYRITLNSVGGQVVVTKFTAKYDVPETRQKGEVTITDAAAGATVVFDPPYVQTPQIGVTAVGTVGLPVVDSVTNEQTVIKLYNLSGTVITGTVNWESIGY